MSKVSIVRITLAIILAGCGPVYRVKVNDVSNPSGIPFYAVVGACTQQTVYANPYYLITLKVSEGSGTVSTDEVKLSPKGHQSADFESLIDELDKPQPELSSVQTAWGLLKQRQSFDPYTQTEGEFILTNTSKASTVVDYSHPYSLNERRPLSGSVSADYKLAPDGTLSEAQAQTQDTTLSTVLSALPISDLIKSAAGIATKVGGAEAQKPQVVQLSLEQEERIRTKTYSVTTVYTSNCPTGAPITDATANTSILVADVGAKDVASKPDTSKSDSSIGISGTISLPKALLQVPTKNDNTSTGGRSTSDTATGNDNIGTPTTKNTGSNSGKKNSQ